MKKLNPIRQGDVMFIPVHRNCLPKGFTEAKEYTVQLGEATGHHHTLYQKDKKSKGLKIFEFEGRRFIDVGAEYFLRHQEHDEHIIAPGAYEVIIEDEYDPFERIMKRVVD